MGKKQLILADDNHLQAPLRKDSAVKALDTLYRYHPEGKYIR